MMLNQDWADRSYHPCYCIGRGDNYHQRNAPGCLLNEEGQRSAEPAEK